MPILKNALKKMHQDSKKTAANQAIKTNLKTVLAKAKKSGASTDLQSAFSALDKAAKKNLIHKNKASRQKARLAKLVKAEVKEIAKTAAKKKVTKKASAKIN